MRIIRFLFWYTVGYFVYNLLCCIPFIGRFLASAYHASVVLVALAPEEEPEPIVATAWDDYKTKWLG